MELQTHCHGSTLPQQTTSNIGTTPERRTGVISEVPATTESTRLKMNAAQITERSNRRDRERTAQLVMIGVLLAKGELDVQPDDCCDDDIGALMEWCHDKRTYSADIRQWFKDKCGVIAKDSEGLPEAVIRTVTTNGKRKRLAKAVEVAALQASNWQTSDDAFFEIVERLTSATGNGSCD